MSVGDRYPEDWDERRRAVYRRDNYRCQECGVGGGPNGPYELHAHHKRPISKGGSHVMSNLVTVCSRCHEAIHGHEIGGGGTGGLGEPAEPVETFDLVEPTASQSQHRGRPAGIGPQLVELGAAAVRSLVDVVLALLLLGMVVVGVVVLAIVGFVGLVVFCLL